MSGVNIPSAAAEFIFVIPVITAVKRIVGRCVGRGFHKRNRRCHKHGRIFFLNFFSQGYEFIVIRKTGRDNEHIRRAGPAEKSEAVFFEYLVLLSHRAAVFKNHYEKILVITASVFIKLYLR